MSFIKKLFDRGEKPAIEPMHGGETIRNKDLEHQVHADTRRRMEAEVAGDRSRRGATDTRPVDVDQ